jgi:hypothetical protein
LRLAAESGVIRFALPRVISYHRKKNKVLDNKGEGNVECPLLGQ